MSAHTTNATYHQRHLPSKSHPETLIAEPTSSVLNRWVKMRSSPLSLAAESVFQYDLERELLIDLNRLRKNACEDGDVVFILSNQTSIWAHSPLFYVAANNKLPTEFGTEAGTVINDRGVIVMMLFISDENRLSFEEVMNSCYTIENLTLLWKAIGGDEVRFRLDRECQHMEMDTSRVKSTLPTSMLPDFEIHLRKAGRELINEPSSFSLKVHRFLLDARITYYQLKTRAGLKLKDATPMSSSLSRTTFTEFSLWSIAMYVYCGIPSIIFNLDPNLQDYIVEPAIRDSRLKRNSYCNEFRTKNRLPAEGIEYGLLEIAKAANFLLAPELDNWAHFQLYRLAHRFQCTGNGCAELIPYIIDAIHCNDITDEWLFNTGITWLARYENIPHLWKWSLLHKSKVIPILIEKIMEIDWECNLDEEARFKRGENAIELFVRLWKLKQYTSMTKDSARWHNELIKPLMEHATQVVVEDLSNSVTFNRLEILLDGMSFSKIAGEELLSRIVNTACTEGFPIKDWCVIEALLGLCEKKQAADSAKEQRSMSPTVNLKDTLPPTGEQLVSEESKAPMNTEHLKDEGPDCEKQNLVETLTVHSSAPGPTGKEDKEKKLADTRLKGSAPPFIPKGIMTLETSSILGNTSLDVKHSHSENSKHLQENIRGFESQDARCWSGSDKSFREFVVHAKRQGPKMRRMMSTPTIQINEPNEMRAGIQRNQNRSYTNPTIGEAVPFRQKNSKHCHARA